MSYIRPATLTNTDIDAIRSIYGDNRDLMIQDLRTGNLPDGVNAEDLLAYVLEERSLNPDDASLAYLWEDDDVVEMLHDMRDKNATDAELAALIRDIEAYLTQAGESTDLMNDAARIINEYAEKYGMDPSTGSKMSEEIQNLVTFFRAVSPEMWLLFDFMYNFGPQVEYAQEVLLEKYDDVTFEIENVIDNMDLISMDEPDAQRDLQVQQTLLNNLQTAQRALNQSFEILNESLQGRLEVVSSLFRRRSSSWRSIIPNMS